MAYPELVKTNHELGPRPTGKREQPQAEFNCQTSTIPRRTIVLSKLHALWLGVYHRYYFTGSGDTGAGGRSELKASTATFQLPSACFLQIATYFPRSVAGEPLGPVIVNT